MSPADSLVLSRAPGLIRAAVIQDGAPVRFLADLAGRESRVANLYRARVRRVERALDLAFLDLGADGDAVLRGRDAGAAGREAGIAAAVQEGALVTVRGRRDAAPGDGKGPRVALGPALPGPRLTFHPEGGARPPGRLSGAPLDALRRALPEAVRAGQVTPTARTADADSEHLRAEHARLAAAWADTPRGEAPGPLLRYADPLTAALIDHGLDCAEIVVDRAADMGAARAWLAEFGGAASVRRATGSAFATEGLEECWEAALARAVPLETGGTLLIERCAAFVAVDVDGGSGAAGRDAATHARAVDQAAAAALARQIRLRDLSGLIVVDFLGAPDRATRRAVTDVLRRGLADDPAPVEVSSMSTAGIVEISRRRTRAALDEVILAPVMPPDLSATYHAACWLDQVRHAILGGGEADLIVPPAWDSALRGPLAGTVVALEAELATRLEWRLAPRTREDLEP